MLLLSVLMAGSAIAGERRRVVADEGSGSKGNSYEALLGQGYRQLWGTSIEVDVLDLKTFAGGLRPVMRVGGLQTASLAMKGADRRNYTFRPLIKDASKLEAIVTQVREMLESHEEIDLSRTLIVNLVSFGPSSLDFFVYTFTKTTVWVRFHEIKQDILLKILAIVHANGADVAFPTTTVQLEKPPAEPEA